MIFLFVVFLLPPLFTFSCPSCPSYYNAISVAFGASIVAIMIFMLYKSIEVSFKHR